MKNLKLDSSTIDCFPWLSTFQLYFLMDETKESVGFFGSWGRISKLYSTVRLISIDWKVTRFWKEELLITSSTFYKCQQLCSTALNPIVCHIGFTSREEKKVELLLLSLISSALWRASGVSLNSNQSYLKSSLL